MGLMIIKLNRFTTYLSNPEILSLIGERLRQWRIKKDLTQNESLEAGVVYLFTHPSIINNFKNNVGFDERRFYRGKWQSFL